MEYFDEKKYEKKSSLDKLEDRLEEAGNATKKIVKTSFPTFGMKSEGSYNNPTLNAGYGEVDKIQLNNIRQVYPGKRGEKEVVIFDDFSMQVKDVKDAGQFVVIVGGSGCGKSTLLRYISGLTRPTSGEIIFNGVPQTSKDRVAMVFQQYTSLPWSTVIENVALPLKIKGIGRDERLDRAFEMLELVGLGDHADKFAQYPLLSGGQLQRVALARSLVSNSEILLLDEPHSGLDVTTKLEMGDLLCNIWSDICKKSDPTFLMVTHDLTEAVYLADEIFVMDSNPGRIIEKIKVDLPLERNSLIKRTKTFLEHQHYLEDLMMRISKK